MIARSVRDFFADRRNRRLLARLAAAGVSTVERAGRASRGPLTGKTLAMTGSLDGLSRDAARALVERAGGRVTGAVSRPDRFPGRGRGAGRQGGGLPPARRENARRARAFAAMVGR